jgi:hypothetical protein
VDIRGKVRQQVTLIGRRLVAMRPKVVMRVADRKGRLERGFGGELQPGWLADGYVGHDGFREKVRAGIFRL